MRALIPTAFALILVAVGCSSDPAPSSEATGEGNLTASVDATSIAERSGCVAGNGGSWVEEFAPASFNAGAIMTKLKADNTNRSCGAHKTSTSREDGIAIFKSFLTEQHDTFASCEDPKLEEDLLKVVEDPTNLGVFSTVPMPDSEDDPVSCYYFHFDVYRADGKHVVFDFDWSD